MKTVARCLFIAGLFFSMNSPTEAETATWDELVGNYQTWRGVYSIMVPPLKASLAEIEQGIASGSYSFTTESGYYWDLTGGDFYVDSEGEIAKTVADGTWVYMIEDLGTAKVFVMQDGQAAPLATFAAEPWPVYDSKTYEVTLLDQLAKRRVVWWLKVRVVADSESEAPANSASAAALAEDGDGGGFAMMMGEGDPANCDPCLQDLDGDGVNNRDELIAGTDPNNPTSYFAFAAFALTNDSGLVYTWYGVTNREYALQTGPTGGYANAYAFSNVTPWLLGNSATISQTDTSTGTNQDFAASRLLVRERDSNTNGIPDWWEIQQYGGLTNINQFGDEDADGLDNREEAYFGYSPTNSERFLYHSPFKVVSVNTNDPTGADDGTEFFDFHGGGRPLSLASNAVDGFGAIDGSPYFSGGFFCNNDTQNLYIGVSGLRLAGPNAFAVFLDTTSGGETSLAHLVAGGAQPYGFSKAANIGFGSGFTPNVGLLLGGKSADGHNYSSYTTAGSRAWGLYAANNATASAFRVFGQALQGSQTLFVDMDNGYIDSPYPVGIELQTSGGQTRFGLYFRGGDSNYRLHDSLGTNVNTGLSYTDQGLRIALTLTAADTYSLTLRRFDNGAVFVTNGTLAGTSGSQIQRVRLYNAGAGGGGSKDAYFNRLRIGPHFDSASDRVYDDGWWTDDNGGSGFSNWTFNATASAGNFTGSSTGNGGGDGNGDGDIDGKENMGQGVYRLSDNGNFDGFSGSGEQPISQWARTYTADSISAHAGVEVAIKLSDLGVSPGDTIKIAAAFLGDTDGTNRWLSPEIYGASVQLPTNSGFQPITIVGAPLQLSSVAQTIPGCADKLFGENDVLFQAFYWNAGSPNKDETQQGDGNWYVTVMSNVFDLATSGFTHVYLPSPVKGESGAYSMGYDPFDHYDLGQYYQNDTTETRFGSRSELTNLTAMLVRSNLVPVVDVVMNHMRQPPGDGGKQFTNYPHGVFFKTTNDFHATPLGHNDTLAPYHQTTEFGSDYYDIAHLTTNMRSGLKRWGAWLVTNAFYGGFRFDLAQKIEPWYVYEWLSFPQQRGRFASAEYWRLSGVRELQEWHSLIGGKAAIWDWKCRDLLYEMCYTNAYNFDISQLTNTLVWQSPHQALAHTENHDTYCPDKRSEPEITRRGIVRQKQLAYAFTIFGEAMPTVYWLDYYDTPYHSGITNLGQVQFGYSGTPLKPEIDRLIWIRRQYLAGSQSYLVTNPALKADLFISLRDGVGTKSGGLLVLNDSESSTLQEQVQTPWIGTVLEDKVPLSGGTSVTTDVNGVVWVGATQRSYRVFVPVN
ncbi:MAG: hypothetical protein M5U15_11620 [Kiritimatiellae bacterium]|nr:hypothetical protein [Kiritimatiellia bacterium]